MPSMKMRFAMALVAVTAALRAQAPAQATPAAAGATAAKATDPTPPKETLASKQRSTAFAMQQSLARQRSSVAKQTGQAEATGFFVLSRPHGSDRVCAERRLRPIARGRSRCPGATGRQKTRIWISRSCAASSSRNPPSAPAPSSPKGAMGSCNSCPLPPTSSASPTHSTPRTRRAGAAFLKQLLARYGGDLTLALGATMRTAKVDAAAGVPKIPKLRIT